MQNGPEPSRDKPCWALQWYGNTKPKKGRATGCKLLLAEYAWRGERWGRTETPTILVTSFYRALRQADWIGVLPHQARKRVVLTAAMLERAAPLFQAGKSQREIARLLGVGNGTVQKLLAFWKERQ